MLLQLENDVKLDIPAGQKDFVVTDKFTLPVDVDLLAIYPHAHYLGKDIQASATLPDGTKKDADPHSALGPELAGGLSLCRAGAFAEGHTVAMRYVYDNSEDNPLNPNHPPVRVRAGNRSSDEMCHLWLQVLPVNFDPAQGDPRMLLQEALARHNVEKRSCRLRSALQPRGHAASKRQAGRCDRKSTRSRSVFAPKMPSRTTRWAGALLASGEPDKAVAYLSRALKTRPDYFDAHYNLGNALASQNDFAGASGAISDLPCNCSPGDADAEANLGSALAEMGRFSEAKTHFERALQINPNHSLAKENLQELQHTMSK